MRYPDRMARRGGGTRPFHTAIGTTFSLDFAAYEEVMLPQLANSGATNLLVIADERMASMALSDGSQLPQSLGRDYELFAPPADTGLFHSKIVLQVGRRCGRLFVGSANITAAGLAGNAEAVVELECSDEPGPEQEIVRSAWRYLSSLVPKDAGAARDALTWASDRAPWLAGGEAEPVQLLEDGTKIAFLAWNGMDGIGSRFVELVGGETVDRLVVASPYWDGTLGALGDLVTGLGAAATTVLLDAEGHEFPTEAKLPAGVEFRAYPDERGFAGRFKHAKFLIASTATTDHVLVGSANCTIAALGREGFRGSNHEACVYRALPRDHAIAALGLTECMTSGKVDLDAMEPREQAPPIPLDEITAGRPGSFELEGLLLTWCPPAAMRSIGRLLLIDIRGDEIGTVDFVLPEGEGRRVTLRLDVERPERIGFVVVETEAFRSNRAHVTHRGLLRRRRREIATGSVARAVALFDAGGDFDLWMHGAFEELARADLADRPVPTKSVARPRQSPDASPPEPRALSYDEFMETRSPDVRADDHGESALSGTHSDSVRGFLNMLVGRSIEMAQPAEDEDWDYLGDEDPERELDQADRRSVDAVPAAAQPGNDEVEVDARQFERMVRQYAANVTKDQSPLGPSDVLRVRFWLMMLLHKARHPGFRGGLEASSEEQGWPRMALRVISAFFCGRQPPITRLMIAKEYREMPVDYLECWATVLWTLDAVEELLTGSIRHRQFLGFVRQARTAVTKVLGLTNAELIGGTVMEVREALDRTLGARLGMTPAKAAA